MRSGALLAATLLSWASCSITMGDDLLEERTETFSLEQGGRLSIRNANGNVSVEPWDGSVVEVTLAIEGAAGGDGAETTNGNITASFAGFAEGMTLETVNGSIRASLPADAAFSAETVNGSVTVGGFNTTTSSRTGVTVQGEPAAEIGTVNGNITVGVIQASASGH